MNSKVFIGCSASQVAIAKAVEKCLKKSYQCVIWNEGADSLDGPNVEALLGHLGNHDFAIFVLAPEDIRYDEKGREHYAVTDNVLFEFGLFMGNLGKRRTFIVMPGHKRVAFKMPSKILGRNYVEYDTEDKIDSVCKTIGGIIDEIGPRDRLSMVKTQKDIFTYVFNRLNPYQDINLTKDFLSGLKNDRLTNVGDVARTLDKLIHNYVRKRVHSDMRVYFAYRRVDEKLKDTERYCFGISYSAQKDDEKWNQGHKLGINSNVHHVYTQKTISPIPYAKKLLNEVEKKNEPVNDEGSVIGCPVLLIDEDTRKVECIGVIGLSSPREEEATQDIFEDLTSEVSVLFSALFYAYGRTRLREKKFDEVVLEMREEISNHFESLINVRGL